MTGLDASGVQNESDVKGRQTPEAGIYHGIVGYVDATLVKHNAIIAELEVLAGEPGDQAGRKVTHMMFLRKEDGAYGDQHLRFALATGLIRPGENKEVYWKDAEGAQIVFGVVVRPGKDKDGRERDYANVGNYGLDIWNVRHPEVADVPKDAAALKLLGGPGASASGIPGPVTPACAAPAATDPYAGI